MRLTFGAAVASLLVLTGAPSEAQTMWGVKAGLDLTKVVQTQCRVDEAPCNLNTKVGFLGGVSATWAPGSGIYGFAPEALFVMKGGKAAGTHLEEKLSYLEVPLLGRVSPKISNFRPFIAAGPSLGFRLSASDSAGTDLSSDFKSVDFGFVVTGGVALTKMISVEGRYEQSLEEQLTSTGRTAFGIINEQDKKTNNRVIAFLLDFSLGNK